MRVVEVEKLLSALLDLWQPQERVDLFLCLVDVFVRFFAGKLAPDHFEIVFTFFRFYLLSEFLV